MVSKKRLIIATLAGILCGYGNVWISELTGMPLDRHIYSALVLNTMLTGFIIGISSIRIHYLPHGILIGCVGSLPAALPALASGAWSMGMLLFMGIIWGILIEIITTKLFKAPAPSLYRAPGR